MDEQVKDPTTIDEQIRILSERGMQVDIGLRVKMCVWLGVSRGLDLAFLNAD